MGKKRVAVIFGGRSVEHDVSILTGLQCLDALDTTLYDGFPIYVDPLGQMWTGPALRKRSLYPVEAAASQGLTSVQLDLASAASGGPRFLVSKKGFLGTKQDALPFDIMIPAIHGSNGEDGTLQGLLEFAGIPYTGCRPLGAAAAMDKAFTKRTARAAGLSVLPELVVDRPEKGAFIDDAWLRTALSDAMPTCDGPWIVKPVNLGSSVGVSKADDADGLMAALLAVFRMDGQAIIEPFVRNLVEYNVAVRETPSGDTVTSAIERPVRGADLLNFTEKYMSGSKTGAPKVDAPSEGMASLNRVINPDELTDKQDRLIRETATRVFDMLDLAGSVRIDFLCDGKTGELWFNEANTVPGSFAWFLWQDAPEPVGFLELTSAMIEEGFKRSSTRLGRTDSSVGGSTIFKAG